MSVKSSTELMLYVVLTMPTLNKAYLFIIYLFKDWSKGDNKLRTLSYEVTIRQLISKVSSAKSLTFTGIQARHYFINVS